MANRSVVVGAFFSDFITYSFSLFLFCFDGTKALIKIKNLIACMISKELGNPAAPLLAFAVPAVPPQETPEAILKLALPHQPCSALFLFHLSTYPASTLTRMWKKYIQKWKWHEDRGRLHTHVIRSREMDLGYVGRQEAASSCRGGLLRPHPRAMSPMGTQETSAPPAWPPVHLNTDSLPHSSMYNIGKIKLVLYCHPMGRQCRLGL